MLAIAILRGSNADPLLVITRKTSLRGPAEVAEFMMRECFDVPEQILLVEGEAVVEHYFSGEDYGVSSDEDE